MTANRPTLYTRLRAWHSARAWKFSKDVSTLSRAVWREEKFFGGHVVRDAAGQALAYLYARSTKSEAMAAKQLTVDESRRIAVNIARLPELLKE